MTGPQEKIEAYLNKLRALLGGMSNEEINDIVEELRSHILEKSTVNGELMGVDDVTGIFSTRWNERIHRGESRSWPFRGTNLSKS